MYLISNVRYTFRERSHRNEVKGVERAASRRRVMRRGEGEGAEVSYLFLLLARAVVN